MVKHAKNTTQSQAGESLNNFKKNGKILLCFLPRLTSQKPLFNVLQEGLKNKTHKFKKEE